MVEKSHTALGWTVSSPSYQIWSHEKCENWILSLFKCNVQFVNSSEPVPQPTKLLSDSPRGGIQSPVCPYCEPHHFYLWETMNDGVYVRTHIHCKNIWREIFNISKQNLCHMWRSTFRMCQGCMGAELQGTNKFLHSWQMQHLYVISLTWQLPCSGS